MNETLVIVGAGHAGCQLASSVREHGYLGRVVLVGEEDEVPYQRPPLSKAYLLGTLEEDGLAIRTPSFFQENGIELITDRATAINRGAQQVRLGSSGEIRYDKLVLATGSRNRPLAVPGADLSGVHQLRSLSEARTLRSALANARSVVVVGAGFIGLEFAAIARQRGARVQVIEAASSVMQRAVSAEVADYVQARHERTGIAFTFGSQVTALLGEAGTVTAVATNRGDVFAADLVLIGIGAVPNSELAADAGIATAARTGGVQVDLGLRTSDPSVWAIGDCADYPSRYAGGRVRLESLQNAQDQARVLASALCGQDVLYESVPWFWTDQGDLKLQIAGLVAGATHRHHVGESSSDRFSVLSFRDDQLIAVESINHGSHHLAARTLLASSPRLTRMTALDPDFDLIKAGAAARAAHRRSLQPATADQLNK
jgi:3-phenylpropionate/trans-cinnamate dioxygenase ferredoxin reductase subunit